MRVELIAAIAVAGLTSSACVERRVAPAAPPTVATSSANASSATRPSPARIEPTSTVDEQVLRSQRSLPPLHRAAFFGDAAEVGRQLDAGTDPNARVPMPQYVLPRPTRRDDTTTPLIAAMAGAASDAQRRSFPPADERSGERSIADLRQRERATRGQPDPARGPMQFVEVERLLLAHGANARAANPNDGLTPLHVAARSGNLELIRPLLAAGGNPNAVDRPRGELPQTPLSIAAGWGDVVLVQALLDAGGDPARVPETSRRNLLIQTVNDPAVLRLLLDHGMVLPAGALKSAASSHAPAESIALIRRHADAAADGDAALVAAIRPTGHDPLTDDESARLLATVRSLLDAGASPSAPDGTGEALVAATVNGRKDVATLLRDRGAKVDWSRLKNNDHQPTKIAYNAAFTNHLDVLRACESLGMPLDVWGASILGRAERLRAAVAEGKTPVAGEAGATPLYFASVYGHADCVRVLLDAGVDPNARMPSWDTPDIGPRPLDGAAAGGHADVVRLLLDRGANPKSMTLDAEDRAKLAPAIAAMLR